jgi:hypothetical protein
MTYHLILVATRSRAFESHGRHVCLSVVSVVCCQVEVCIELITRPEELYRVWCVECNGEDCTLGKPWPTRGCCAVETKIDLASVVLSSNVNRIQHSLSILCVLIH